MRSFQLITNSAELRLCEDNEIRIHESINDRDDIDLRNRPLISSPKLLCLCVDLRRIKGLDGRYNTSFVMTYHSRSRIYAKRLFYFGKKAGEDDLILMNNWCSLVKSHAAIAKVISDLHREVMQKHYDKGIMDAIAGTIDTNTGQLIDACDRWGKILVFKVYKEILPYPLENIVTIPHLIYIDPEVAEEYVHYKKTKKDPKEENSQLDIRKYMLPIFDMRLPKNKNKKSFIYN